MHQASYSFGSQEVPEASYKQRKATQLCYSSYLFRASKQTMRHLNVSESVICCQQVVGILVDA